MATILNVSKEAIRLFEDAESGFRDVVMIYQTEEKLPIGYRWDVDYLKLKEKYDIAIQCEMDVIKMLEKNSNKKDEHIDRLNTLLEHRVVVVNTIKKNKCKSQ